MSEQNKIKILVGNDDGIASIGIDVIARNAESWGDITVVAPASQQTASGKAMTFHKPLRINKGKTNSGIKAYTYNTTPADAVIIYEELVGTPDIVLSGINAGENTSIHSVLTSGTCAVAMEGGLKDIPAFAFSIDTPEKYFHGNEIPGNIELAGKLSIKIAKAFVETVKPDFWHKTIFVNINFPDNLNEKTEIICRNLDTHKYNNYLHKKTDPKGDTYYWLWGNRREDFDTSGDSYSVLIDKKIVITPIAMQDHDYLFEVTEDIISQLANGK